MKTKKIEQWGLYDKERKKLETIVLNEIGSNGEEVIVLFDSKETAVEYRDTVHLDHTIPRKVILTLTV